MEDIDVLPESLRRRSLSSKEIVLKYTDALCAIEILEAANWLILGWEPWWKIPNGGHIHPLGGGDFDRRPGENWDSAVYRIAWECREALKQEQIHWEHEHHLQLIDSSCQGQTSTTMLYFCLSATDC